MTKLSSEPRNDRPLGPHVLICGTNWLGDSVMSMPALQLYKKRHPTTRLIMLVKPHLKELWEMHPAIEEVVILGSGNKGMSQTVAQLREKKIEKAYIFPNSFRSALVPWLAAVPERIGIAKNARGRLLTQRLHFPERMHEKHQMHEYEYILAEYAGEKSLPTPRLLVPEVPFTLLPNSPGKWIGIIPGAARGPAKRWSVDSFRRLVKMILARRDEGVLILGAPGDVDVCSEVAVNLDEERVINRCGQTSLVQMASLLSRCSSVVTNDSGGMHLAAAVGTPLVALFGITDPAKTGPLGAHSVVIQHSEIQSRELSPNDPRGIEALARINPDEVYEAIKSLLSNP